MAARGRKPGKSTKGWKEAIEDAVKKIEQPGTYTVVSMQVVVGTNSPGVVHEYRVELE
jgi:flavin-binding protein dodecin